MYEWAYIKLFIFCFIFLQLEALVYYCFSTFTKWVIFKKIFFTGWSLNSIHMWCVGILLCFRAKASTTLINCWILKYFKHIYLYIICLHEKLFLPNSKTLSTHIENVWKFNRTTSITHFIALTFTPFLLQNIDLAYGAGYLFY